MATIGQLYKLDTDEGRIEARPANTSAIVRLAVDESDGTVWGYSSGNLSAYDQGGKLLSSTRVPQAPAVCDHIALAVDNISGHAWLALDKKLHHFNDRGQLLKTFTLEDQAQDLSFDPNTRKLWVATESTVKALDANGALVQTLALPKKAAVRALAIDRGSSALWVALSDSLRLYSSSGTQVLQKPIKSLNRLADDGDHGVWAASGHRLLRISATGQILVDRIPLLITIDSMTVDRTDHSVWVGGLLLVRHVDANGWNICTFTLLRILSDLALFVAPQPVNRPPVAVNDTATTAPNAAVSIAVLANDSDPDNNPLTISAFTQGSQGKVTKSASFLTYTPANGFRGVDKFQYTIADGKGGTATATVTVTVDRPPVITTTAPTTATVGQLYRYDVDASDPDVGDTVVFSLDSAPAGMVIDAATGVIQWTPTGAQIGANNVSVRAGDAAGLFAIQSFTVQVSAAPPVNRPPSIISGPVTTGAVNQLYVYDVDATDPDAGDILTYSLDLAPTGMTINSASGVIQWTPGAAQTGAQSVTVRVRDVGGLFATQSFAVQVDSPANGAPFFTSAPPTTAVVGQLYTYDADATDPDGQAINFLLDAAPNGMTIDAATGLIQWTPLATQLEGNSVSIRVRDSSGNFAVQNFVIQVNPIPTLPPVITSTPVTTAAVGKPYTYKVIATDPDAGDVITYSLNGAPVGMTVDGATGMITWSPVITQTGAQNVTAIASDGRGGTASQTFSVNVSAAQANRAPTAQDDQYAVRRGETLNVSAPGVLQNDSDPDGQSLTSVLVGSPTKGTFNFNGDGSFNYTPTVPAPNSTEPTLKFSYRETIDPTVTSTLTQPLVVDLDGDGVAEIVFNSLGPFGHCRLIALHGNDGSVYFSKDVFQPTANPPVVLCDAFSQLAGGDIDGDGFPEIIAVDGFDGSNPATDIFRRQLIAFNHDGTHKWTSEDILTKDVRGGLGPILSTSGFTKPVIADLNGDGVPEVLVGYNGRIASSPGAAPEDFVTAFDNQGRILWTVRGGGSGTDSNGGTVLVQDINLDGKPEIIYGDDVYDNEGNRLWSAAACFTCNPQVKDVAVANLDDDAFAEIIYFDRFGQLYVYEHTGALKWGPLDVGDASSLLTVGDVDGDGRPEIVVTSNTNIVVVARDGSTARSIPIPSAILDGAGGNTTIFDLNGDGKPELIHNGLHSSFDTGIGTGAVQTGAVYIFDGTTGTLLHSIRAVRGGGTYNVQGPVVADVDGDGAAEIVTGGWNGSPLLHVFEGKNNHWAQARPIYNQYSYNATNVNDDGTIPAQPAINWLTPGLNNFRVNIPLPEERIGDNDRFTYKANDGALDSNTATVRIDILPPNHAPQILSQAPTVASPNIEYLYGVLAFDADAGEILAFSLAQAPAGMSINAVNGLVRWTPTGSQIGRHVVALKVTDSQGEFAYQGYSVEVVGAVTVPNVVGQTQTAAQNSLAGAGLSVGTTASTASSNVPAGNVISQGIAAGTTVPAGTAVALVISSGPLTAAVPNVVGQTQASAQSAISGRGLNVGTVTTAPSTNVAAGNIISQDPAGGTPVPLGTGVNLIVSIGTIDLTGLTSIVVDPVAATILVGEEQAYNATGVFNDGTSRNLTGIVGWSSTTPAAATISAVGIAKGLADGATTIQASANSIVGSATLTVRSRIADGTLPNAAIVEPANNAEVTSPVDVVGNATDANFLKYRLEYAPAGETTFTLLNESTTPVANGVLGKFDPTLLINDQYTLRLTVFDRGGNTQQASVNVQVARDMKVGNFSLTFTDLSVPMSGLPIVVNRVYDSRDKGKGDFGIGWRLSLQTMRIRTNRVLGTGWVRNQSGAVISLAPTDAHKVSVTLPNGRVEEFDMQVSPTSGLGSLDFTNVVGFTARAGTTGKLEALTDNALVIVNAGSLDELVEFGTLNTYNPQLYRYTSADGAEFVVHKTTGVQSIKDSNGNTLTFGPNGIVHSAGKSALFQRDSEGRIVQLTDPRGNVQIYSYDSNGDLISHTDALSNVTRFSYNGRHDLLQITDPLNRAAVRNEYDDAGRLVAQVDANGKRATFAHNVDGQEEVLTDTRGAARRVVYDGQGNVTQEERPVTIDGALVTARTTWTYDSLGNETSRVDPDGVRTASTFNGVLPSSEILDPNGLRLATSFAYNAQNDIAAVIDPGNRTFSFSYDGKRNITQVSTPVLGTAASQVNAQGLPTRVQDALGNVTLFTRDASGNVTREEVMDVAAVVLRRKDFSYDPNGNKVSETLQRTIGGVPTALTTLYAYDGKNRLISVTDPAGGVSRIEYDAVANETARTDALGRRTEFTYDDLRRRIRTTYPDGTFDTASYDSEGNVISQRDRAQRTTTFEYDELNRLVRTLFPDGTSTRTIYSAGGRTTATVDAKGNRTDYTYDTAGRRIATILPQVLDGATGNNERPQTSSVFNSLNLPANVTDPNGRQTSYQYDQAGRPIRTTFADATFVAQQFDTLGRRTSVTNEEGQITNFAYDGLARLKAVSGLPGNATYSYDEAGNLLTQTDALGRVTRFRYDILNRQVEKQYPAGEVERYAYDAVGNLTALTTPNGQTISFEYDTENRLVRKRLPGGAAVAYTYTPTGQRASVTDARGITSYAYDALDRLITVTQPDGQTISYTRDANGNLASLTTPGAAVSYAYDALNRLTGVIAPEGQSQSAYDLAGNRVRMTAANGIVTDYAYDARNRPTLLAHRTASGSLLQSFNTVFSAAGRRAQVTELNGSVEQYGYDARGRLASETRTGSNPFSITHSYDAVGNRTQRVTNGAPTSFTYDSNDRLLSDGSATYVYDANGNLTMQTAGAALTQYAYDAENRLTSVSDATGTTEFGYDADGNRVRVSSPAGVTHLLVDTENHTRLSQAIEERDNAGNLQARYTYGDERLTMVRGGSTRIYHGDTHGSTRMLTDNAQTVTDTYTYDGYGQTVSATGATANPYRYSGERVDNGAGSYHLRARQYSPSLGRFTARDPFPGHLQSPISLHPYAYANADPINYRDPTGLESLAELSLSQAISNTLKFIETGGGIKTYCDIRGRIEAVGAVIFWGSLAGSGLLGLTGSELGDVGKGAISLVGINPAAFNANSLKKIEIRLEFDQKRLAALKFAFDYKGKKREDITIGLGSVGLASGYNFEFPYQACKLDIGKAILKVRGKAMLDANVFAPLTYANRPYLATSLGISAELNLFFGLFRYEYPIYETSLSTSMGPQQKFFGR